MLDKWCKAHLKNHQRGILINPKSFRDSNFTWTIDLFKIFIKELLRHAPTIHNANIPARIPNPRTSHVEIGISWTYTVCGGTYHVLGSIVLSSVGGSLTKNGSFAAGTTLAAGLS